MVKSRAATYGAMLPANLESACINPNSVIARGAAKQSTLACELSAYGSPWYCAPGDDVLWQSFPSRVAISSLFNMPSKV